MCLNTFKITQNIICKKFLLRKSYYQKKQSAKKFPHFYPLINIKLSTNTQKRQKLALHVSRETLKGLKNLVESFT